MDRKNHEKKRNTAIFGKSTWALIILVLFLAAISYFNSEPVNNIQKWVQTHMPQNIDSNKRIKHEVKAVLQETNSKNREAYEIALKEQKDEINAAFDRADEGIEPAMDELVSFKGCAKLCYCLEKDKLYETCETEERISSVLKMPFEKNVLEGNRMAKNIFARLNDTLARNTTDMKIKLASTAKPVLDSEDEKAQSAFRNFNARLSAGSKDLNIIAIDTVADVSALIISGVFVKATCTQITRVLGPIAGRLGITTASALGAAAADGPLPIGDAIGLVVEVGAVSWCAYDLYNAQVTLRDKVGWQLKNALVQYRSEILKLSEKRLVKLLKAYNNQNARMAKKFEKTIIVKRQK